MTEDIESQVTNDLYELLTAEFPGIDIGTLSDPIPMKYPYVNIKMSDQTPTSRFINSSRVIPYRDITIEIEVYTNLVSGRKAQAKSIMAVIDAEMLAMGATGTALNPLDLTNPVDNSSVFRLFARYRATVDKDGIFYSRR